MVWNIAKQQSDAEMDQFENKMLNAGRVLQVFFQKLKENVPFLLESFNTNKFSWIKYSHYFAII